MRYFFFLLTTLMLAGATNAQRAEDSVKAVINDLFTAMRTGDAALLRSSFAENAILQGFARPKGGGDIFVATESVAEFADFVSTVKKDSADERIRFETVKVDGTLAIAWTPYRFYHNGKFSHCGVNSFQLVRLAGVWKIQYLIDTKRKTACLPE